VPTPASIREQSVDSLIAGISAASPTPGSAAAAAVALALAAACAGKAANITLKHMPGAAGLQQAIDRFQECSRRALLSADEDAKAFERHLRDNDARADAWLVELGNEFLTTIGALEQALQSIEPKISRIVAGDLVAARALADAARSIQARNLAEIES
jgi:hypothetical protein